jgi:hypothetical protein
VEMISDVPARAPSQPSLYHIAQLVEDERIGREPEALAPMGLEPNELEVALHTAPGDPRLAGHLAHTPVRRAIARLVIAGLADQPRHLLII